MQDIAKHNRYNSRLQNQLIFIAKKKKKKENLFIAIIIHQRALIQSFLKSGLEMKNQSIHESAPK